MPGEDHVTTSGELVRLTHIVRPSLLRHTHPTAGALGLPTPENSDLSAPPSSDSEVQTDPSGSSDSEETEMGFPDDEHVGDITLTQGVPSLSAAMDELQLQETSLYRAISNSSSWYASSEGEGESDGEGMADSFSIPRPPVAGGGWVSMSFNDFNTGGVPLPRPVTQGTRDVREKPSFFEYLYGE